MKVNQKNAAKEDILRKFEEIHYYNDTDIIKYVDAQKSMQIKDQIEEINKQIENLGKICDSKIANSGTLYKQNIKDQRKNLDNNLKDYIGSLRLKLTNLRNRINFDYDSKFEEVYKRTMDISNEYKNSINKKKSLELNNEIENENIVFIEKQYNIMSDLNFYLKYKLKYLLNEIEDSKEKNILKTAPLGSSETNKKLDDFLITNIEYKNKNITNLYDIDKNRNIKTDKSKYKIYYQKSKENSRSLKTEGNLPKKEEMKQKNINEFSDKLDKIYTILANKIEKEKNINNNLKSVFEKLFIKINNPFVKILKSSDLEKYPYQVNKSYNYINKKINRKVSPSSRKSNSYGEQSTLPSIQRSCSSIKSYKDGSFLFDEYNVFNGYQNKTESKKTIINFIKKIKIKKLIYHIMYETELTSSV